MNGDISGGRERGVGGGLKGGEGEGGEGGWRTREWMKEGGQGRGGRGKWEGVKEGVRRVC